MYVKTSRWLPIHLSHVLLMSCLYALSRTQLYAAPIYAPWRDIAGLFLLCLGLFGWIPLWRGSATGLSLRGSPYFLFLALMARRAPNRRNRPSWRSYWRHPLVRYRWALLVLKAYFIPLVTGNFVVAVKSVWSIPRYQMSFPLAILFIRYAAMLFSSSIATLGYTVESKRYGVPIKAVETSLLGWLFCLSCYPPVRALPAMVITARFFDHHRLFPADSRADIVCSALAAFFLVVHVWTIVSQGLRFANLTYRGTISRGPFGMVRHPQYATKLTGWFFEWLPYFRYLPNVAFFFGWVGLYIGRALTEERFLSKFMDYRAYKAQVRWRFIPGVW